jgi:hypothetical protein
MYNAVAMGRLGNNLVCLLITKKKHACRSRFNRVPVRLNYFLVMKHRFSLTIFQREYHSATWIAGVPFSNMDSDANTLQLRPQKEPHRILYWSNFLKLNNIYIFFKKIL